MPELFLFLQFTLVIAIVVLLIVLIVLVIRRYSGQALERQLQENSRLNQQVTELVGTQLNQRISEQTDSLGQQLAEQTRSTNEQLAEQARNTNEHLASQNQTLNDRITEQTKATNERLTEQNAALTSELARNREELSRELKQVRETMEARLGAIQQDNSKKLDEMRAVVDEKLSETLQQRFSESFTLISERLESVQKGLGEMQVLAGNVTDLKNILANVKTRGNFGEYQLQTLLEDILAPDQYEQNFAPKPRSQQRVEFAVRLPMEGEPVYMPIDSKFPIEDYQRLLDAYDQADSALIDSTYKDLVSKALRFARDIRDKYLNPPRTTDYAIMFVPTEGLYGELVRKPGLLDELRKQRVMLAGPNNLQAMLVNFQIGFSSIAIGQRAGEIEKLLSAVKTEFGSFHSILEKVDQRLVQARTEIEKATKKTSKIQSRLRGVTELPASESALLLESADASESEAEIIEVEDIEVEE